MNRRIDILALAIFVIASVALTGCASMRHVSADKFVRTLNRPAETQVNTLQDRVDIIGITSDRVYLEYRPALNLLGPSTKVYWTELSELPDEIQQQLKAGKYPIPRWYPSDNLNIKLIPVKKER